MFNRMNDTDFGEDVDLMDQHSEYGDAELTNKETKMCESADRMLSSEERTRMVIVDKLMDEIRIKDQALEKLKVKEKSFEEAMNEVKEDCAKRLETAKLHEAKLQEKITALEKRNSLLEYELKRRVDQPDKKELRPKSSVRSILRQSHSEERKVESSRLIKYVRVSPKKQQQKDQSPRKRFSIETSYVKKVLSELLTEQTNKLSKVEQIVSREEERLAEYIEVLSNSKVELRDIPDQPLPKQTDQLAFYQSMYEDLSVIVKQQQGVIETMKGQEQDLKVCLHEFLNIVLSNHSQHGGSWGPNLSEMERLLTIMTRSIRQRFTRKRKDSQDARTLKNSNAELSKIAKLYLEVKYNVGLKDNSSHQQLLNRIDGFRLQSRSLQQENEQLKSIVEGLIKLARK